MAKSGLVETKLSSGVFELRLNNPDRRNALSLAMLDAISKALLKAENDTEARVIVISASGPVFCAGHDLKEITAARNSADRGQAFFKSTMEACSSMMQQIVTHRLPVIAQIDGTATAAGCQLVASCDLAVASTDAKFATPGVNIGLFCSTPMVALSRNVSSKHAMEMLLTGIPISAKKAEEIGLINRAVKPEMVSETVESFTSQIVKKSAMTLKTGKQAFYRQAEMSLPDAYDYCSAVMVDNMLKADAQEGIEAFIEKRNPVWQDA